MKEHEDSCTKHYFLNTNGHVISSITGHERLTSACYDTNILNIKVLVKTLRGGGEFFQFLVTRTCASARQLRFSGHGYTEMAALTSTPLFWFGYLCVVLFVSAGEQQKQHSSHMSQSYITIHYLNTIHPYRSCLKHWR